MNSSPAPDFVPRLIRAVGGLVAANGGARLLGIGAQIALGYVLLDDELGAYAFALAVTSTAMALRNFGLGPLVMAQRSLGDRSLTRLMRRTRIANIVLAAVVAGLGFALAGGVGLPQARGLIVILALSVPLAGIADMKQSQLAVRNEHGQIARLRVVAAVINHVTSVCLALLGMGALGLAFGNLVGYAADAVMSQRALRRLTLCGHKMVVERPLAQIARRDVGLAVATAMAGVGIMHGDYLVLSGTTSVSVLGQYFYAYQLTVALSTLMTGAITKVLLPAFTSIADTPQRLAVLYRQTVRASIVAGLLFCVPAAFLVPPMMRTMWGSKWEPAAGAAAVLLISLPFRVTNPISDSALQAVAGWRRVSILSWADALGTVAAAFIGAQFGTVQAIATVVGFWKVVAALLRVYGVHGLIDPGGRHLQAVVRPVVVAGIALSVGIGLSMLAPQLGSGFRAVVAAFLYTLGTRSELTRLGKYALRYLGPR